MPDWRTELASIYEGVREEAERARVERDRIEGQRPAFKEFVETTVAPALEELAGELDRHGRRIQLFHGAITVFRNDQRELSFSVRLDPGTGATTAHFSGTTSSGEAVSGDEPLKSGSQGYSLAEVTQGDVIGAFLRIYRNFARPD